MSKYILPLQKGTEALPESVVQLPAVRWRGLESGSTEADSIMKQYGGAISSFYVQQSQNYSLSTVDQSKAFRWLSQTIGVEYLNQSGKEYLTIYAQAKTRQPRQEEFKQEEEKKPEKKEEPLEECWYPQKSTGKLFSDSIVKKNRVAQITSVDDSAYQTLVEIGFTLKMFGQKYTNFGFSPNGYLVLGSITTDAYLPNVDGGNASFPGPPLGDGPAICPYFADVDIREDGGSVYVLNGSAIFGTEVKPRKFVVIRWDQVGYWSRNNDANTDGRCNFEVILIEGASRSSREDCPALIGFSYTNMQWESGEGLGGVDGFGNAQAYVGFCTGDQVSLGNIPAAQEAGVSNVVADKQLWFKVDPSKGTPTPIHNFPWIKK